MTEMTRNQAEKTEQDSIQLPRIKFTTKISSGLLREYFSKNIGLVIKVYGRIGGLLRMTSDNNVINAMVSDWSATNMDIALAQVEEIEAQHEAALLAAGVTNGDEAGVVVDRPEPLEVDWSVNHPSFHVLRKVIVKIDEAIVKAENLYYEGVMDDIQFRSLQAQAVNVIGGILDRVRKATAPGKRTTKGVTRYVAAELSKHIREGGYRLEFFDVPASVREMTQEYDARHAAMKSLIEQRKREQEKRKATEKKSKEASVDKSQGELIKDSEVA
ncbi:hypothetical protein I633_22556 (plasmid) [Alteromonas mediterranea 615]|uniref:Uncharacterized protein n=1 Tax=Alteromonas mediterranea 615 TaxID=1300253 RepID=S5ALS6_9ALTE|nr:hypothetical protein I633_22556 [Alteromonas mediterranea 615]|tara:strand:+ start:3125 stop:3940 length:816 start_codon:yes stop_codon:yes gene_type:complete